MKPSHVFIALVSFAAGIVVGHFTSWLRFSSHVMDAMEQVVERHGTMKVRCVAKKYTWHFQHAGEDGELAEVNPSFVTETNPAGINPADPRGRDDKVAAELVLPCQESIELSTTSLDLIHSLGGLPGVKDVDATPGVTERRFFETSETPQTGRLSCVQLCGPGCKDHVTSFRFVAEPEFREWLQTQ
jgi:cytochrome c oxidase subunit 2